MYLSYHYISITPETSLVRTPFSQSPSAPRNNLGCDFSHSRLVLLILNGLFWDWLLSHSTMSMWFIHVVGFTSSLFIFIAELCSIVQMYHSSSILLLIGIWVVFNFLHLVIKLLCTFLYLYFGGNNALIPLGSISRSGIAGSWSSPANRFHDRGFQAISTSLLQDPLLIGPTPPLPIDQMPLAPNSLYWRSLFDRTRRALDPEPRDLNPCVKFTPK